MASLVLCFRSQLRSRVVAWLGLALVVGLTAAVVLAAVAGGRRTDSAYLRFADRYRANDVAFLDDGETPRPPDLAKIERLPQVEATARGRLFYTLGDFSAIAPADQAWGTRIDRVKLLEGRVPDPRRADEVLVGFVAAERLGLHVGSTFPLVEPEHAAEAARAGIENVRFRVVGIEAAPGEFPPQYPGSGILFHMTPALYRKFADTEVLPRRDSLIVRLEHGDADMPAFIAGVERLGGGKPVLYLTQRQSTVPIQRSFHLQATALWLLAGLVGLVGLLVFSQTFARQAFLESTEVPTLRALGVSRRQLFGLGMARAAFVAVVASFVAVVAAVLLSPLAPIGVARIAEPDPGLLPDVAVLVIGALATIGLVLALAALPTWRAVQLAGSPLGLAQPVGAARRSAVGDAVSRVGLPPAIATGIRLALEPGRGRSAVPVRTTLAGLVLAVSALSAALVFGASLDRLITTPRLYGWDWDLKVTNYGAGPDLAPRAGAIRATPGIREVSIGDSGFPIDVGRAREVNMIGVDGPVTVPVLAGRAPAGDDEIALGRKTMRRAEVGIGGVVDVRFSGLPSHKMTVVGRVVVPAPPETRLGEGAAMTHAGLRRLLPSAMASELYARLEPGAKQEEVIAALRPLVGRDAFTVIESEKPSDILNFGRVQNLPVILAGVIAFLAGATLVHTLVSSARRRRRDLAVMKTIGFVRRQIFAVVLWQATTLAATAVLVGVPLGLALGRWAWAVFAHETGVVREPTVSGWQVAVVVAGTILLANLVAALPARLAARTRPAEALRAE